MWKPQNGFGVDIVCSVNSQNLVSDWLIDEKKKGFSRLIREHTKEKQQQKPQLMTGPKNDCVLFRSKSH
jgi:hypothetical protein